MQYYQFAISAVSGKLAAWPACSPIVVATARPECSQRDLFLSRGLGRVSPDAT